MAHYAILDETNIVTSVIVGRDETDIVAGVTDWEAYYAFVLKIPAEQVRRTSYNTRSGVHYDPATGEPSADQSKAFRGTYAGIGYTYDPDADEFVAPPEPEQPTEPEGA